MTQFQLAKNTLFNINQEYYWPGDYSEARYFLESIRFVEYSDDPYNPLVVFKEDYPEAEGWSLFETVNSALYYYLDETLKDNKGTKGALFDYVDWSLLLNLVLYYKTSQSALIFLRDLGVIKISPKEVIQEGAVYLLKGMSLFQFPLWVFTPQNRIGLENLLFFLGFEQNKINDLIESCLQTKSFNPIVSSILNEELEINERFVLECDLKSFNQIDQDLKSFENNLLQLTRGFIITNYRNKLEEFNALDIFESSEFSKIKLNNLNLISFYDSLFFDLDKKEKNQDVDLFLLFENHVFFDLNLNLIDLSLKDISEKLLHFCVLYKDVLKSIFLKKPVLVDSFKIQNQLKTENAVFLNTNFPYIRFCNDLPLLF